MMWGYSYRDIDALALRSHRTIAKARHVLEAEGYMSDAQVKALTAEDLDRLLTDGRKPVPGVFVPIDVEAVVAARIGRKKPPLKVSWARYLETAVGGTVQDEAFDSGCGVKRCAVGLCGPAPSWQVPIRRKPLARTEANF